MNSESLMTSSERAGQHVARFYRVIDDREKRMTHWLAVKGIPSWVGRLLLWGTKLVLFGILLYGAFWLAVFLFVGLTAAWIVKRSSPNNDDKLEWREGHSGFGLYDKNEWRRDMGDPEEPS